ncbi:hypothetical protein LX36DRAFT_136911 [Colletotrichum falcatum]|nr:hypothetical protein LX36DRAFT_136911 [Colletotrichum falcatum]
MNCSPCFVGPGPNLRDLVEPSPSVRCPPFAGTSLARPLGIPTWAGRQAGLGLLSALYSVALRPLIHR